MPEEEGLEPFAVEQLGTGQPAVDNEGWRRVFSQFLPEHDIVEVLDGETLSITLADGQDPENARQRLSDLFSDPAEIGSQLDGQLVDTSQDPAKVSEMPETVVRSRWETPDAPEPGAVKRILKRVLGELDLGDGLVLNFSKLFKHAGVGDIPVLFSPPLKSQEYSLSDALDQLSAIPLAVLRARYLGEDDPQSDSSMQSLGRSFWEKLLYLKKTEQGLRVVFDASVFHQMLFPPKFTVDPAQDGRYRLRVNRRHFTACLNQAFRRGAMLTGPMEGGRRVIALPSFFSAGLRDVHLFVLVDVSGSMGSVQEPLRHQLSAWIDTLSPYFQSDRDTLYLIPFSDGRIPEDLSASAFHLNRDGQLDQAKEYAGSIECNGRTRLHGILGDLLKHPVFVAQQLVNRLVLMVTDGRDTVDHNGEEYVRMESGFEEIRKGKLFQSILVGFGSEYDDELCDKIAQATGGTHEQMRSIGDLKRIFDGHSWKLSVQRTLRRIFERAISVYHTPEVLPEVVEEGKPFMIEDEQVSFVKGVLRRVTYLPAPALPPALPEGGPALPAGELPTRGRLSWFRELDPLAWMIQLVGAQSLMNSSLFGSPRRYLGGLFGLGARVVVNSTALAEDAAAAPRLEA